MISSDISIEYNLLTTEELNYLETLMYDSSNQKFWAQFNQEDQYFDSMEVDRSRLTNYLDKITDNGVHKVKEMGLNLVSPSRQLDDSSHFDVCDFSYVTYLNDDFSGGDFIFQLDGKEFSISSKKGMSIRLQNNIIHRVDRVSKGQRFSLYTFLWYGNKS